MRLTYPYFKVLLFVFFLNIFTLAKAEVKFSIVNPCVNSEIYINVSQIKSEISVAKLTYAQLENSKLPFQATDYGVFSIANTPTGLDSNEVISDNHMRSYGWCYEINGIISDKLANDTFLKPTENYAIRWYYGYAEFLNGEWNPNYCQPLYLKPKQFICGN